MNRQTLLLPGANHVSMKKPVMCNECWQVPVNYPDRTKCLDCVVRIANRQLAIDLKRRTEILWKRALIFAGVAYLVFYAGWTVFELGK